MTANITYTKGQINNGGLFFNMEAGPEETTLSVTGYTHDREYHFIAWSKEVDISYQVIQVQYWAIEDWWRNNRRHFGKILQIVKGGVQNLPDELVTRLNKLLFEKEV